MTLTERDKSEFPVVEIYTWDGDIAIDLKILFMMRKCYFTECAVMILMFYSNMFLNIICECIFYILLFFYLGT